MSWYIYEEEFPCGYKFKSEARGLFMVGHIDNKTEGCPLHGKNCTRIPYLGKKKKLPRTHKKNR